jgi:6-methylsalicylate decarboxylase
VSVGSTPPNEGKGYIDIHHHITAPGSPRLGLPNWSPHLAVEEMDRNGVATGIGFPGPIDVADIAQGRALARSWNEYGTQMGCDYPGRFGLFAALPMMDTDGTLAEIAYAADVLGSDGFGIATNYGDNWLGSERFRPILAELNSRKAVVFVHPNRAPCSTPDALSYVGNFNSGWIEYPMNTARSILDLVASGTLRAFPEIRFIFCHGGGLMPLLLGRIEGFKAWNMVGPEKMRELFPDGIAAEYRKLYFECAQAYATEAFHAVETTADASHLLFGTDFDRFSIAHSIDMLNALELSPALERAIIRDNAASLLPRWS